MKRNPQTAYYFRQASLDNEASATGHTPAFFTSRMRIEKTHTRGLSFGIGLLYFAPPPPQKKNISSYCRLNMELGLQSLFWLLYTAEFLGWDPGASPLPPAFGLIYEGDIDQPR